MLSSYRIALTGHQPRGVPGCPPLSCLLLLPCLAFAVSFHVAPGLTTRPPEEEEDPTRKISPSTSSARTQYRRPQTGRRGRRRTSPTRLHNRARAPSGDAAGDLPPISWLEHHHRVRRAGDLPRPLASTAAHLLWSSYCRVKLSNNVRRQP